MQIRTNNLSHIFDKGGVNEFKALSEVTTTIRKGEFISVIGMTGSGKTTFIEHLNALLRPTTGEVIIDGKVIIPGKKKIKKVKSFRKKVGIVFQFAEYQLFEETIYKDIIFGPKNMGLPEEKYKKAADKYIRLVGLPKSYLERSPFQLSGGQKRRVALAGILAMEPDILIFDEPTAGLDPEGASDMYKIFKKLHKQGKSIVIVTHNLDHALEFSDRILLFNKGKLVKDGNTSEILYDEKLIKKNKLEVPKLVSLVNKLEKKGKIIGKVKSIAQLVKKI